MVKHHHTRHARPHSHDYLDYFQSPQKDYPGKTILTFRLSEVRSLNIFKSVHLYNSFHFSYWTLEWLESTVTRFFRSFFLQEKYARRASICLTIPSHPNKHPRRAKRSDWNSGNWKWTQWTWKNSRPLVSAINSSREWISMGRWNSLEVGCSKVKGWIAGLWTLSLAFTLLFTVIYASWIILADWQTLKL